MPVTEKLTLIADDAKTRRAWVIYQLALRGKSLASLAREHGVRRQTLRSALIRTYPRMERAIAQALDMQPNESFPERYDDRGIPLYRMGRPRKCRVVNNDNNKSAVNDSTDGKTNKPRWQSEIYSARDA